MRVDDFRQYHYLVKMGRCTAPSRVVCAAVATVERYAANDMYKKVREFKAGAVFYDRDKKGDTDNMQCDMTAIREEFWDMVAGYASTDHTLWMFAANLGELLTVTDFWWMLESGIFTLGPPRGSLCANGRRMNKRSRPSKGYAVLNDTPTIISCTRAEKRIMMVDINNYFGGSVSMYGSCQGNAERVPPLGSAGDEAWKSWALGKAMATREVVWGLINYWRESDMGPWAPTAAGLAMNAYRSKFMGDAKILVHGDKRANALERYGYFGGQTIAAFMGMVGKKVSTSKGIFNRTIDRFPVEKGPVHVVDVNSMYPYLMYTNAMPAKLVNHTMTCDVDGLRAMADKYIMFAAVKIHSPLEAYPCRVYTSGNSPCITELSNGITVSQYEDTRCVYARGTFCTVLCGPELLRALETNSILEVGWASFYRPQILFRGYVKDLWEERVAFSVCGNDLYSHFTKILLNSLWGKFGQKTGQWVSDKTVTPDRPWGTWSIFDTKKRRPTFYRSIGWHTQRLCDRAETEHSCPAIAAFITSLGREHMYQLRKVVGDRNWFYQDTDSLHVNDTGLSVLAGIGELAEGEMGKLKIEGSYDTAEYYGPKRYRLGEHWIVSGVKASAELISGCHWRQEMVDRLPSIINGQPGGVVIQRGKDVLLCQHEDSSLKGDDGWTVPLTL